jgi:hypothetical protein
MKNFDFENIFIKGHLNPYKNSSETSYLLSVSVVSMF